MDLYPFAVKALHGFDGAIHGKSVVLPERTSRCVPGTPFMAHNASAQSSAPDSERALSGLQSRNPFRVAVVVAHPDDETLWAGGLLLSHPEWSLFIVSLCRGSDLDRAPKFRKALERLGATGVMGELDDGPDQAPLSTAVVQEAILSLLPERKYDLLVTHGPKGEYTRHRRHEELSYAIWKLWRNRILRADELWQFAYEDGGGTCLPHPSKDASLQHPLSKPMWMDKTAILTEIYGFLDGSWEVRASPRIEAFKVFRQPG